jgi:hypothetical protein
MGAFVGGEAVPVMDAVLSKPFIAFILSFFFKV